MATYFNKYYFEFQDSHVTYPATWRVDIMDSQGDVPTDPFLLTMGASPLSLQRTNTADSKDVFFIGEQANITYVFDGNPNIPLPIEFFEATERRYRVEIRKNGNIYGVYFIKPDFCQYPDQYRFPGEIVPFEVQLKAIDGLGYAEGTLFNIYADSGLLFYEITELYDIIMTRALAQILDAGTIINVINTLLPENIGLTTRTFFNLFVHTDQFYDFVKGAQSVKDVIIAFCKTFYASIFMAQGQLWFIRTQDLDQTTFNADQYISDSIVNDLSLPDFVLTVGPDPSSFDAMPVDEIATITMIPAIKRAEFEVIYKSINQVNNFDWSQFDGTDFAGWTRAAGIEVNRAGLGTVIDPYMLQIPLNQIVGGFKFLQQIRFGIINPGDIVEMSFKYEFFNCKRVQLFISVGDVLGGPDHRFRLDSGGNWVFDGPGLTAIEIGRSGKKKIGSFSIKSIPIPGLYPDETSMAANSDIQISILAPLDAITDDGPGDAYIKIGPIKLGNIGISSEGRHITITNQADFTQVKEKVDFNFIDTGENGLSNTIFVLDGFDFAPAENWDNDKPGVNEADIEFHMSKAHIDQYSRSLTMWEGKLYSNVINFYNLFELSHMPGKRFMQLNDQYEVRTCTHQITMLEVLQEGNSTVDYLEYDVEEDNNN